MSIKKKQIKFDERAKEKLILRYLVPEPQINLINLIRNKAVSVLKERKVKVAKREWLTKLKDQAYIEIVE